MDVPGNFCVAPFLQLTTHPTTSFSPCPYLGGTTWKKEYPTIQERWLSPDLENLREQFLDDQRPEVCHRCWHEEDNGKSSLRLRLYDPRKKTSDYSVINHYGILQDMIDGLPQRTYQAGPKILTIKNGNVCNAKCRSCHPGDSSRWAKDADMLAQALGKTYYSINVSEKNWSDEQIEEIYSLSKNLVRLELFGGEPLFNKKVVSLLNRIIAAGHSKNLNLYINTNGSVDLVEKVPEIHRFKEVEIGVSLDAIDQEFAYIRHGLDYQEVVANIRSWQAHAVKHKAKIYVDSITTVSVLNILSLRDIKQQVMSILPQAPFWNLLIHPEYLFIKNMPDGLKQMAIDRLSPDPEFNDIISVIRQQADPGAWQIFKEITLALDKIRQEDICKTFPDLGRWIDF